ncbi:hypothetical protein Tco_0692196 [Tanacetum coccineum]
MQYQNEVNDIRAERIAKKNKCNIIFHKTKSIYQTQDQVHPQDQPYSESVSDEDNDLEQAQWDKDMQKNLALQAKNKTEDTTPRYNNDNQSGKFGNQRTMTVAGARETVLPEESSSTSTDQPLKQVQKHDEHNVFANERRHSKQPESINDTYVSEKDDRNVTPDLSNICNNDNQENKTILKQLKKANASLTQELEECKTNLDETSRALGEATSCRDSCLIALQNKQNEFEKYKAFNDRTIDYDILQTKLNETLGLLALKDIEIKEGLKTKAYEILVLNQKHDELVKKSLLTKDNNW